MSSIKRQPQVPTGAGSQAPLARAPRTDIVNAVTVPTANAPEASTPPQKKRTVTFTNKLDPDLLDWMDAYKQRTTVTIAAQLDEAVRNFMEKNRNEMP